MLRLHLHPRPVPPCAGQPVGMRLPPKHVVNVTASHCVLVTDELADDEEEDPHRVDRNDRDEQN